MVTKKQVDEAYDKAYAAQEAAREACAWAETYLNRYHKLKKEYANENGNLRYLFNKLKREYENGK